MADNYNMTAKPQVNTPIIPDNVIGQATPSGLHQCIVTTFWDDNASRSSNPIVGATLHGLKRCAN